MTSHRKAKGRSIAAIIQKQSVISGTNDDELEEPPEFVDSDTDPAWTPNDDKVIFETQNNFELEFSLDIGKIKTNRFC